MNIDNLASKVGAAGESVASKRNDRKQKLREKNFNVNDKMNILVMGVSGAGKSTLVNAIIGKEVARTGKGDSVTKSMKSYESEDLPFRLVDTIGFEYGVLRQQKIKRAVKKWSEKGLKMENSDNVIHAIWFCIDAQSQRISKNSLDNIARVSKMWKNVPIIVIFTKNYSKEAAEENEKTFKKVLFKYRKKRKLNINGIVSILAKEFVIDKNSKIDAYGTDRLLDLTKEMMPHAKDVNTEIMERMSVKVLKRSAESYVKTATAASALVAFLPTEKPDGDFIKDIQRNMLNRISNEFALDDSGTERLLRLVDKSDATSRIGRKVVNMRFIRRIPFIKSYVAGAGTYSLGKLALELAEMRI